MRKRRASPATIDPGPWQRRIADQTSPRRRTHQRGSGAGPSARRLALPQQRLTPPWLSQLAARPWYATLRMKSRRRTREVPPSRRSNRSPKPPITATFNVAGRTAMTSTTGSTRNAHFARAAETPNYQLPMPKAAHQLDFGSWELGVKTRPELRRPPAASGCRQRCAAALADFRGS
jgi:hypothetical protein